MTHADPHTRCRAGAELHAPAAAWLFGSAAWLLLSLALLVASAALAAAPALAAHPDRLDTAVQEPAYFSWSMQDEAFRRTHDQAGAQWVKLDFAWDDVAPDAPVKPSGFDASNPGDGHYNWEGVDRAVRRSVRAGLTPFMNIIDAPAWAERPAGARRGYNNPDPVELGRFFGATARRYSGTYRGLPRVRAFEVWNEVNASFFFMPQKDGNGNPYSPILYRRMVNDVADAVHGVHADNLVIAGGLFPFFVDRPAAQTVAPMRFMRQFLCMTRKLRPGRNCGAPVKFDVWSHHPYTEGSPTHQVGSPDSVSIGQLDGMGRLLRAADRQGRIQGRGHARFWVSEWAWDSNAPDPAGVPLALHARWTSEALYRMWDAGVSLATWFFLRDGAGRDANFQSGLYLRCAQGITCDQPKPALQAYRFPFVAFRGRGVLVWGRTPNGRPARVVIERSRRGGWKRVAVLGTNAHGLFTRRLHAPRHGSYRARLAGHSEASVPFSLKRPPDFRVSPPVG
jgi:hypothetical protein